MPERNKCLVVELYYGRDAIISFDLLLTEWGVSYVKERLDHYIYGRYYKFIILEYKNQDFIDTFIYAYKEDVIRCECHLITDETIELFRTLFML